MGAETKPFKVPTIRTARQKIIQLLWEKQFENSPWRSKFNLIEPGSLEKDYGALADQILAATGVEPFTPFICGQSDEKCSNGLPLNFSVCPAYGADWFAFYSQDDGWRPMDEEPGDHRFRLYGLNVRHTSGHEWFEIHYLRRDEDSGDMITPGGDNFSEWSFADFEVWKSLLLPEPR